MTEHENIAVLGAGSWGTALAFALARNGHTVTLWAHRKSHCDDLSRDRANQKYLAGFEFPDNIVVEQDLSKLVGSHTNYLLVTPSHAFRDTLKLLKQHKVSEQAHIAWATKGFDKQGPTLLSNVVEQELGQGVARAIVSGPSFSKEVAGDLPTAITVAGDSPEFTRLVAKWFHGNNMRVYTNSDLIGVQIGGATKNVMAIAAGISDGFGFGANSRSAIITRGLAEISRLGIALGADPISFQGLAGMGDLVLTCTDNQSRNRRLGLGLGKGMRLQEVMDEIGQEVEGYTTTPEVIRLANKHQVEMPICEQVHRVLYEGVSAKEAVSVLLSRGLADEFE